MQDIFSKKIKLSRGARLLYDRFANQLEIQNKKARKPLLASLNKSVALNYEILSGLFNCGKAQIKRYLVELEDANLITRYTIHSEVINGQRHKNISYISLS